MTLNPDQEKLATHLSRWWKCNQTYIVIDSKGGTGKTYLIDKVLQRLGSCTPLLLCPTNESLKQLRDKLTNPEEYDLKTIHSALGIRPTVSKTELKFELGKVPDLAEKYKLIVVDEASMVDNDILNALISTGVKIIWVGHSSQLPPIDVKRARLDKCISPVFAQGWETLVLKTPMRNTGILWDFNCKVEDMIYDHTLQLPKDFDISKTELQKYILSKEGIEDIYSEQTKVVLWSNSGVDRYNNDLRQVLFGKDKARENKYIPGDKLIFTKPYNLIENLDRYRESGLLSLQNDKEAITGFFSNTKLEVLGSKEVVVKLNKELAIPCYKIKVLCEGDTHFIYEAVEKENLEYVAMYYEHIAWGRKTPQAKAKAYRQRHFILSCFAELKYYYAATSHRLQGASIPKVIVIFNDICKNINPVERRKCLYVATSRCVDDLKIYRGV